MIGNNDGNIISLDFIGRNLIFFMFFITFARNSETPNCFGISFGQKQKTHTYRLLYVSMKMCWFYFFQGFLHN